LHYGFRETLAYIGELSLGNLFTRGK